MAGWDGLPEEFLFGVATAGFQIEGGFNGPGADRERGCVWSDLVSMGADSAGAYRRIISGLRRGDRSVVD